MHELSWIILIATHTGVIRSLYTHDQQSELRPDLSYMCPFPLIEGLYGPGGGGRGFLAA